MIYYDKLCSMQYFGNLLIVDVMQEINQNLLKVAFYKCKFSFLKLLLANSVG
jgi:hypothetical protein